MDALESFLSFFGSSLCHQIAERSYSLDSFQMPLCARCLGIHLGFLFGAVFIILCRFARHHGCMLQNVRHMLALALLAVPAVMDVSLSYAGVTESNNAIRSVTGAFFGVALAFILLPLLRALMNSIPLLGGHMLPASHMIPPLVIAVATSAVAIASESSTMLFYAVAIAGVAGVFATMLTLVLMIVTLVTDSSEWWSGRRMEVAGVITPIVLVILALANEFVG